MLTLAIVLASAHAGDLLLVPRLWGTGAVRWQDGDRSLVLQSFAAPVEIVATEVAPGEKYAFTWYHPDGRARRVAIYELTTGRVIADFAPGFGGRLEFTAGGRTLVHTWGCGTDCQNLVVYDTHGRTLLTVAGTGVDVSPGRRFGASFPLVFAGCRRVTLYDLGTGAIVSDNPLGHAFAVDQVTWDETHDTVTFAVRDIDDARDTLLVPLPR